MRPLRALACGMLVAAGALASPLPVADATSTPAIPTGLTATPGADQVTLAWNANPSTDAVDGYQVYRDGTLIASGNNDPAHPGLPTVSGTTYTDRVNGPHEYRVSAHNAAGYGDWTAGVTAGPNGLPATPVGLRATQGSGQATLSWTPNASTDNVDGYQVYRDDVLIASGTNDPSHPGLPTVTGTSYTDRTSGSHHYRVSAHNATGYSEWTDAVTPTPPTSPPAVPSGLTASGGGGQVTLGWSANPPSDDVDGYQVYRDGALIASGTSDPAYPNAAPVSGTSFVDHVSGSHEYRVSAHNAAGYGNWSGPVTADAGSATSSSTTTDPPPSAIPAGASWFSTFEDSNPWSKWEGYSQPLQVLQGGANADQIQVVDSQAAGVPAPPGYSASTKVLQAFVTSADFHQYADNYPNSYCCVHAKLYHGWGGSGPGNGPQMQPGQEGGNYRAWYYLPPSTQTWPLNGLPQSPAGKSEIPWVNIMQWKTVDLSSGQQVVTAEADLLPINGVVWLSLGSGWPSSWPPSDQNAVKAPVGQWFELRADYQHSGAIDWYINGTHVWSNTGMPALQQGQGWIFGIGHYSGIGELYAKNASFTPGP